MSRKHFVEIASALNATRPDNNASIREKQLWNQIVQSIANALGQFNAQFKWGIFERACGGLHILNS